MNSIKRYGFLIFSSVCVLIFTLSIVIGIRAQEMGDILSYWVGNDSISLYVQGKKDLDVKVQIGTKEIKDIKVVPLEEIEKIETLILVDNSLSTTEDTRPIITEMLTGVVGNRLPNESISIATFSKNIDYKVKDTTDYTELKRTVDSLEYKYQDAYLLPTIYDLIKDYATEDNNIFRRVIIISDGASDEEIGVTVSEVISELNKFKLPIYTFGCKANDGANNSDLENLYSIARATGAEYWTINEIDSPENVASQFSKRLAEIDRVDIKLPKSLRDGSEKGVKLSMINGGLRLESSTTVKMPFSSSEKSNNTIFVVIILLSTVVILLLIVLIIILNRKGKDDRNQDILNETVTGDNAPVNNTGDYIQNRRGPAPINNDRRIIKNRVRTVAPVPAANTDGNVDITPVQPDRSNVNAAGVNSDETLPCKIGERKPAPMMVVEAMGTVWEKNLSKNIIIGRGENADIRINDRTVSKEHCKIYFENGNIYIEDLESSNGTFIGIQDIAKTGKYCMNIDKLKMVLGDIDVILEVLR